MGEMVGELNYNRILVPLDGSDESKSVLPYIRDLSPRFGSEVHILGVCIGSKRRRINELLEEYINDLSNELIQDSVKAKPVIIYGRPAEKILAYTKENDIDLVLMSTHGRSGVARWWLGSVAERVASEAHVPVCLVRSEIVDRAKPKNKTSINSILVPLDGSELGESALAHAEAIAIKTGASIDLIQVIPPSGVLEASLLGGEFRKLAESMHKSGENYLNSIAEKLGKKSVNTIYKVVSGDPANTIVEYSTQKNIGLIAMSTHGKSGIARWMLGNVADKILHEASMPIWLVRSPKMIFTRHKL